MHNRRDQVHAHGFMVGRLVSALLQGDPDLSVPPLRRSWSGLVIGSLLAALAVGGLAVLARVHPGGATAWQKPGTLIVEKQTGNRYVLVEGQLRPVLNYASARLLLGTKLEVDAVPSSSIADVPRGGPVGITGAPDSLPKPGGTIAPWLVCASVVPNAMGSGSPAVSLAIGDVPDVRPLSPRQAVLVRTSDGKTYLVAGGRRMRLTEPWVTRALGFADSAAIGVRDAWLNTLPPGPDLPQPAPAGLGDAGPDLDGHQTNVGEVLVVHGAGAAPRFYLLTADGLEPMTPTALALALSAPGTAAAYPGGTAAARELSPAALASARLLPEPAWQAQVPASPPTLDAATGGRMPCVQAVLDGKRVTMSLVTLPAVPVTSANAAAGATPVADRTVPDGRVADRVEIAPKAGLFARILPASGVLGQGVYLVTEDGRKFPVATEAAANALGYSLPSAAPVPADLLALLPTGPVLNTLGTGGGTGR